MNLGLDTLKVITEASDRAIVVFDKESREVLYGNSRFYKISDISEADVIGKPCNEVVCKMGPWDSSKCICFNIAAGAEAVETYNEAKDIYFSMSAKEVNWNGRAAMAFFMEDITAAKRKDEEIKLQNQALKVKNDEIERIYNNIPGAAFRCRFDERWTIITANDGLYSFLGYTREEFAAMGNCMASVIYPPDYAIMAERISNQLHNGNTRVENENRLICKDGSIKWISIKGQLLMDEKGGQYFYCVFVDISKQKTAEAELQANQRNLNIAMEHAKMIYAYYDFDAATCTFSDASQRLIGLPKVLTNFPEDFFKLDRVYPEDVPLYKEKLVQVKAGAPYTELKVRFQEKTGKGLRWSKVRFTGIKNEAGKPIGAICTSENISEFMEAMRHYESAVQYREHTQPENLLVSVHCNLNQNRILEINDYTGANLLARLSNKRSAFVKGMSNAIIDEAQRTKFYNTFSNAGIISNYERGNTQLSMEIQLSLNPGETPKWVQIQMTMVMEPTTRELEGFFTIVDVTEQVRAELIVQKLVKLDYESIFAIDAATGRPVSFGRNKSNELLKRQNELKDYEGGLESYIRAHCVDKDVDAVVKQVSLPYVRQQLEKAPIYTTMYTLRMENQIVHKRAMYAYLEDSRQSLLCAVQDISKTYEEEEKQKNKLTEALAAAEQASQAKTEFFSRMSHDMRTPMNGILGLAGLAENEQDPVALKESMGKIKNAGEYLLSLINDTLDFQRIESGKLQLTPKIVNSEQCLRDVIAMVQTSAKEKGIELRVVNKNARMDWYINMDPVRLKQIFVNLLSNAIKFTPKGGVVSFEIECLERVGMVSNNRLRVKDTGIGMSQEFIDNKIFKPFSQEYNEVTSQYAGSGLGLSIVKSLVEMMGGSIRVESWLGSGSCFTVDLPFHRVEPSSVYTDNKAEAKHKEEVFKELKGKRILLVEDHPLNAEIAKRLLQKTGSIVIWRKNGEEAVNTYRESAPGQYDAILMDIRMPVMNGLEASRAIRSLDKPEAKRIPIIAMTANAYQEDVEASLKAGMNAHLAKPIEPKSLYETLAKYVNQDRN